MNHDELRPETRAIRAGRPDRPGAPLNTPIVTASTYHLGGDREYSRGDGTETVDAFEAAVGELEGGWSVAFSSGMAAVSAVLDQLPQEARIAAPSDCYQGVAMILDERAASAGWKVERIRTDDTDSWLSVIGARPDLVWLESPSNPMLTVGDVPAICAAAERAGVATAVDSTFATPLLQRPLDQGATYSIHSATKFIGGHSDLIGGVVSTADPAARDGLRRRQLLGGAVIGGMEAFLALRGLRTLPVRLARAQASAADLALRLSNHRAVTAVHYPGLTTDPGYPVAKRSLAGPGAVLSFQTLGQPDDVDRALGELTVVAPATSLGGVESTIERRARLAGQAHVPATLLRLSVGCEHVEDLWADLGEMLAKLEGLTTR
ncbi:MAG: PLP-dependent aspartate aminotransferase family protein [Actinomycetota bacterium]